MSSTTFVGQPDVMVGGPPPPPPPPPVPNQLPAMRINTVENTAGRRPQIVSNDAYEPPAAIQNAMLTKDKKPFTYTPGMGGKLDLSQIRSPRMARRVAKNANDEGIEGPPKVAVESKPPGTSTAANLMVQPQVAIPVLPVNVPAAPLLNRAPSSVNKTSSNTLDKQAETPKIATPKVDIKAVPITISSSQSSTPESPNTPTQVTLAKAPTPWMQNKNKPQENLPEWAKRPTVNKTANSPSENAQSPTTIYVQVQPSVPQSSQTKLKQEQERHPTPQDQCQQPLKVQQLPQQRQEPQQKQNMATSPQTNSPRNERVVPIRIEDRPSVFDVNRESGHHQFKQPPTVHHQQRWGQIPVQQHTLKNQVQNRSQDQEQSNIHVATVSKPVQSQPSGTTYIIPMVVESDKKTTPSNTGYNTIEKGIRVVQQQGSAPNTPLIQQNEPGPVQSRSFRVLQKITDTDGPNDVGTEQMRKLDLSEDDRLLMNKFKEQVDHETYLHQEEDPRYRGAAIPSRAFRFLQNMTESNDSSVTCTAPRSSQNIANKRQNRNSKSFEETQINLPPSEQQVQEPKKYMGSAIPSRSFKILQAMTTPESIATQENRQADYNCQTENNLPGNQQDVFLLSQPVPFWYPESWWYCYSVQQYSDPSAKSANSTNEHSLLPRPYTGYSDGGACVGYYESFSPVCSNARYSQADYDGIQQSGTDGNGCDNIYYSVTDPPFAQNDRHFVQNDIVDESTNTRSQIDHLDDQSSGTSRSANENCNKTRLVTNTVDEEDIALDSTDNDTVSNNRKMSERTFDLCINVPNYTYMESSDSSDSSDSSKSSSNKLADSCQKVRNCSDTTFSNTSSDSDSDSYVAYSTGLHLYEKLDRNASRATSSDVSGVQNAVAYSGESSTDNCRSDFDSCSDNCELNRRVQECEPTTANTVRRHQMNVIDEDTERSDSKGSHCENERNVDERKNALFETTDDPSDDVETMVSVSLPLRFNFSVSENNEDITTVTIGDSKIKAEKSRNSKRRYSDKSSDDNVDNTRVDVTNDTSVKFTVKRYVADAANTASGRETAIPCVDFTLKRDSTKINEGSRERQKNIKTKFTSNETEKESEKNDLESESVLKEVENRAILKSEIVVREDILPHENEKNHRDRVQHIGSNFENDNRTIRESKANTCEWIQDNFEAPVQVQVIDANETHNKTCINAQDNNDDLIINSNDRCVDLEIDQTHTKHLLSVRDSHEDTDDEDSGVTSDISRMISEADTDSECTSSKTSKKYQRTQTHSRLFRLLNDDTVLSDCSKTDSSFSRLEYPNSPLNVYNDDDDCYCINYSSDPISPEYSSVRDEQSSRRSYNATIGSSNTSSPNIVKLNHPSSQLKHVPSKDDPHLLAWKSSKLTDLDNVVPSLAYKILDSKMPSWAYKVNVLCPRIKSTKDVPRTLSARPTGNIDNRPSSVILTIPTSCAHSKTK